MKVFAGQTSDFGERQRKIVTVGDEDVVVLRLGDRFHAFRNICPHSGGPVGEGMLINKVEAVLSEDGERVLGETFSPDCVHLVCPWHGWEFDVETGAFAGDPRFQLQRFDTHVEGDEVYVLAP